MFYLFYILDDVNSQVPSKNSYDEKNILRPTFGANIKQY